MTILLLEALIGEDDQVNELCVVGSDDALGAWAIAKAVPLRHIGGTWTIEIEGLKAGSHVQFSFFTRARKTRTIARCESSQLPVHEVTISVDQPVTPVKFDRIVFENGSSFLTVDAEVQIGFGIRNNSPAIVLRGQAVSDAIVHAVINIDNDDLIPMTPMAGYEPENGAWNKDRPLQLHARVLESRLLSSSIVFHVTTDDGTSCVAAVGIRQLTNSAGSVETPLLLAEGLNVVGSIFVSYLVVLPFKDAANMLNIRNTFFPWAYGKQVKVGHRGSGSSQRKAPGLPRSEYTENTVNSFRVATRRGTVDMIEFDVMLTKDNIAIIHHNWKTHVFAQRTASRIVETLPIPLRDLTLEELRVLRTEFSSEPRRRLAHYIRSNLREIINLGRAEALADGGVKKSSVSNRLSFGWFECIRALARRIPTLKEAFESVPDHIGFNVEIKFPLNKVGRPSKDNFADRNQFVDTILRDILLYRNNRNIVISCFDPDVCSMVKLKQPSMPVLFLTSAGEPMYGSYTDVRTMSISAAIAHCRAHSLLGICSFSRPLLMNHALISDIKTNNLMLFTWGEDNNKTENVQQQRLLGVDGIIADVHST